jgi:TP901 family phage tail tape measure protein
MADLNANINVGIETTQALDQLKALQRQISQFHQSVSKSSAQASLAQRDLQRNFLNGVNAIQGFSAELKTVRTTAESFTNSLEKNKFSMREYFRYSASQTRTFGKRFAAEMSTIEKTAIERVKTLQTQYIKMGRDASGAMKAIAIRPTMLNMKDLGTQTAIAAQKQVIFNQLLKQGSTNLLNFGKNTQWAGRQLMVGFTLPLATLGMTAGRVFFDMEKAAIKFKKVYGDLFTAPEETKKAMDSIVALGEAYAAYGIAVSDTLDLAGDAAAAGFSGVDLQNQTTAALRLSVLGQLDLQKSLATTISLQNAFRLSSGDLSEAIDFLNAVENQSVVALEDITTAIPKVAPVIQALGGDVRDLAFFIAAMKESGVNASEGANALKSSLGRLVNPSKAASDYLQTLGINIRGIVDRNAGDLQGMIFEVGQALDTLDPLTRSRAIERLFGKFQFARMSALFDNINRDGSQAARVLELAGASASQLADLAESELGVSAASSMNKFKSSVEQLKVALVPIGELFVEIATPFVEFGTKVLEAFNSLPGGVKAAIGTVITILGGIGPIALMTFGLINNGIANMIKFFATVRLGYLKITGQAKGVGDETNYMTQEQLEAAAAAASLDQAHAGLTQRFTAEKAAVDALRVAYQQAAEAGASFALNYPGMMKPVPATQAQAFAKGGIVSGPGTGTSDSIPALLSNGEAVIPARQAKKYAPIVQGMIAGNLPGFADGVFLGMPRSNKSVNKNREVADEIYEDFLKSKYAKVPPTNYGHQISKTSGHSFPIFGLGGVYSKPGGKKVFVKPVLDEAGALAEIRATQIARQAHGLEAPIQKIVVIRDPLDPTRERRFLALESALDTKFVQNEPKAIFNEDQYFRQLVASLVRVDKDLSASNVFGNVVADVGPAGVFDRASGKRALKTDLSSMEDQALINLLGIKGGAKRAFAESTLALMAGLTPAQYHQRMIGEIQKVLPALRKTISEFGLSDPTEIKAYDAMIKRLETGLTVDWSKFHTIHSKVVPAIPKKPRAPKVAEAVNLANGGMVRGPGGPKDDAIPANLSNGEAVIDAATVKKNPGIIAALFQKKKIQIPGYSENNGDSGNLPEAVERASSSIPKIEKVYTEYRRAAAGLGEVSDLLETKLLEFSRIKDDKRLRRELNAVPGLDLLSSSTKSKVTEEGDPRKTGSQGIVKMHAGLSRVPVANPDDLAGIVSAEIIARIKEGNLAATLMDNLTFPAPAAANQGKLTGTEFGQWVGENPETFMDQIAQQGELESNNPDLMRVAANVERQLLAAGSQAIGESEFGQIIQRAIAEEIDAVGSNTAQKVKQVFDEARKISVVQVGGAGGRVPIRESARGRTFEVDDVSREMSSQLPYNDKKFQIPAGADEAHDRFVERLSPERIRQAVQPGAENLAEQIVDTTGEALLNASRSNSPSQETIQATENMVDGVTETLNKGVPEVEVATEKLIDPITNPNPKRDGSSFGPGSKEPVPAVGNPPRTAAPAQVVQTMSQEATATKTFIGSIKASFASMRDNLTRELGWVKEEFKTLTGGIKNNTTQANQDAIQNTQKNIEINRAANNQIISDNQKAGFNYIAAMQGRNGAVEAILTKGNAAIISKATEQFNIGSRLIPKLISKGLKSSYPEFEFAGKRIGQVIAENARLGAQGVLPAGAPDGAVAGDATGFVGPMPAAGLQKFEQNFGRMSQGLSQFSMSLSAVSGIMYMFGGEVGQVAGYISVFSGSIFALVGILDTMIKLQVIAKAQEKIKIIQNVLETASRSANIASMGFFTAAATVAGVAISTAFSPLIIGIAAVVAIIAVLAGGFFIYNGLVEAASARINGLADAAFVAGEKLKAIANVIGFEPTRDPATSAGSIQDFSGLEAGAASGAREIGESQEFKDLIGEGGAYKKDLDALKNATVDEAQTALNSLITQLIAVAPKDFDVAQIQAFAAAVAAEAGKTDLDFSLAVQLNPYVAENADLVIDLANQQAAQIAEDYESSLGQVSWVSDNLGAAVADGLGLELNEELQKSSQIQASSLNSYFEQLQTGLLSGTLDTQTYLDKTEALLGTLSSMPEIYALDVLDNMLTNVGIPTEKLAGITDFANKLAVSQALLAGADVSDEELKAIDAADNMFASDEQKEAGILALEAIEARKVKAVEESAEAVAAAIAAEKAARASTDMSAIEAEIQLNRDKIDQAKDLIAAGMDEADAYAAVTDEIWQNIFAQAKLDDMKNDPSGQDTTNIDAARDAFAESKQAAEDYNNAVEAGNLARYLADAEEDVRLKGELEENNFSAADSALILNNEMLRGAFITRFANGELTQFKAELESFKAIELTKGGGGSNPIQDAIKSLKEQRNEILNTSAAYSSLRNSGESAADAFKFAQNPQLMSAMNAGLKVGSARFKEIIKLIKEAEAATKSWQNATVQGQTEMFEDVYKKAINVFDANEGLLDAAFESATKADKQLIKFLEKQIDNINRQIDEYSRDLDGIAEAEEEINKTYDKKIEALEKVKKVNDDILRQQKSQISLADALSQGDISAAANIIEEKRAADAASALEAQGNRDTFVRDAQIAGITSKNGLTRVQIEEKVKQLKKDIEVIEFGALRDAQDRVKAAEEELEAKKDSLMVAGQTREQLELSKSAIDLAKASAQGYDEELQNALASVTGIVNQWKALGTTFTTTHKINTIRDPGSPPPATSTARAATGGYISGPGTATSDSIPAMLSDGEYVIKAASVDKFGTGFLDSVNKGQLPKFRLGGMVRDGGGSSKSKPAPAKTKAQIEADERRRNAASPSLAGSGLARSLMSTKPILSPFEQKEAVTAAAFAQAQQEAIAQRQRDVLYKQGGAQGFEAGFQSTMVAFGKSDVGKFLGDAYSGTGIGNMVFRGVLAVLSTPAEIVGSFAKNTLDFIAKPNLMSLIKLNPFLAANEGTRNAFSGFLDPSQQTDSMFEQAGQTVIDNKMFGAGNPESDALARIIAGSLNIFGDPTTYVGVGAIKAGIKAGVAAGVRNTPIGQASTIAQAAGIRPKIGFNVVERTEQAIVAKETASTIDNAISELKSSNNLTPSQYRAMLNMREVLTNIDRGSTGPKIPLQFPDIQKPLQDLAPEQIRDVALYYGSQSRANAFINSGNLTPNRVGLSPYEVVTGNRRTRVQQTNPVLDFLSTRGLIPKLPAIRGVEKQIQEGLSLNNPGLGITPNAGPFAKILLGGDGVLDAFASPQASPFKLADMIPGVNKNKLVGPGSAFISRNILKELDDVVIHEGKHAFDNLSSRLRPDSEILPSLRQAMDETGYVQNAAAEASAKAAEAIFAKSPVNPYAPMNIFDPEELIPTFASNQLRIKDFLTTYLVPSKSSTPPRWYQYGSDWVKLYKESTILNEKAFGIKIHDDATMDGLQRAQRFLESSNFSSVSPTNGKANVESIIKSIAAYNGIDDHAKNLAISNLIQQAKLLGIKGISQSSYAKGGIVKPSYYAKGGIVKPSYYAKGGIVKPSYYAGGGMVKPSHFSEGGFAKGTDTVPAMLTPGEFVVNRESSKTFAPLLSSINSEGRSFDLPVYPKIERNYSEPSVGGNVYQNNEVADSSARVDNSVYNYSLNVNVSGSSSNANDIANVVMNKIKSIESQQVRKQVLR